MEQHIDVFCCPRCNADLLFDDDAIECMSCRQRYDIVDGIPHLFWSEEASASTGNVTERIRAFYEEHPFPDYDGFDNVGTLIEKARQGVFAKLLDEQIPFGARVVDVGCGTGQLANFLSVANRTVVGTDLSLSSLRLAYDFKVSNALDRAHFFQMNLFRPCFKPGSFDLVISNGVLHHTADPFLALKTISRLAKPGRYVLIGLYHKYGRMATDLRRVIFRMTNDRLRFLDRRTVSEDLSPAKRKAWFMDQYKNPHESKHTVSQVLGWLDQLGLKFVKSIPKTKLFARFSSGEKLFDPEEPGNWLERRAVELSMAFTGNREGGFFVVIAQKKAGEAQSDTAAT